MTKAVVKIHEPVEETPSQAIVAKAAAQVNVTTPDGRVLTIKKPGVMAQFDMIEMLGDTARNAVYVSMVLPLLYLLAIDGEVVKRPKTKLELRALIERLDEDGIGALGEGVREHFGAKDEDASEDEAVKKE